jgi:transcription antitermination factor NusG
MELQTSSDRWFALMVRTRWEQSTEALLRGKGYETFLPTYQPATPRKSRGDRSTPFFPGYVFCRFQLERRLPVLITPGVISVIGRGKVPVPLEDSEMMSVRAAVQSDLPVQPWPYLEVGDRVRVEAMGGLEGLLISFRGTRRLIVSVSLLRRSVALEIDRAKVTPIEPAERAYRELLSLPYRWANEST